MKIFNLNFKNLVGATLVASTLFLGTVSMTSCGKVEGCTDPAASNYDADATDDDGSCTYCGCTDNTANNYDATATCDNGSCTYDREAFFGTYATNETCTSGTYSYSMTIAAGSQNTVTIILTNLGNFSNNVLNATVSGTTLTIPSQTLTIQGTAVAFVGQGTLNGNTLTINYSATYNGTTDTCTATGIKQ